MGFWRCSLHWSADLASEPPPAAGGTELAALAGSTTPNPPPPPQPPLFRPTTNYRFRRVDQFDLWIWVQLYDPASSAGLDMVQEVVNAWYLLGRLGAYDATSMKVMRSARYDLSHLPYGRDEDGEPEDSRVSSPAAMMDATDLESKGTWLRFWCSDWSCVVFGGGKGGGFVQGAVCRGGSQPPQIGHGHQLCCSRQALWPRRAGVPPRRGDVPHAVQPDPLTHARAATPAGWTWGRPTIWLWTS